MGTFSGLFVEDEKVKTSVKSVEGTFEGLFSSEYRKKSAATLAKKQADKAQSFSGTMKATAYDLGTRLIQGPEKKLSDVFTGATPEAGWNVISTSLSDSAKRLTDWGQTISSPKASATQKIVATGEVGMGWLNNAFTVVTAPLEAARTIPVIGNVADLISNIFSMVGKGGSDIGISGLNRLPISDKTKKEATPLVGEIFALGAQIALGKGGEVAKSRFIAKSSELTNKVNEDIRVQLKIASESGETKIPIKTPSTKQAEYARSMGYEPYTPTERLPIIEFGKRQKTTEPVVKLPTGEFKFPTPKGTRLVPERPQIFEGLFKPQEQGIPTAKEIARAVVRQEPYRAEPIKAPAQPAAEVPVMEPIGRGQMKESRVASRIEEAAVEKGLIEAFENIPEYAQLNRKEQTRLAMEVFRQEPERAFRIAVGKELPPPNIVPEAFAIAAEKLATLRGDVATLQKLASEGLSLQGTAMGQRISMWAERDQLSPVKIISEIKKGREEAYEKKTGKSVEQAKRTEVAKMREEIKKGSSKRQDWDSFIKEITCGY